MTLAPLRVLSLQPFYGGSHRQFNDQWIRNSCHQWTTIGLPDRHWKWRMRHACIYFAERIQAELAAGNHWDVVICTDMLGLAELKGLMPRRASQIPMVMYFHENQFEYPNQTTQQRDQHFAFTNLTSAIAADQLWFNSQYNFDSMMTGLREQARRWPDYAPHHAIDLLPAKVQIQPPGLEMPPIDAFHYQELRAQRIANRQPIHLLWAARWEHDKNPADLWQALVQLRQNGVEFQLSVIGQQFKKSPEQFEWIRREFKSSIVHWGYQASRTAYWNVLAASDVLISTASHEFFGIAAAEAIAMGLYPLLPNRLAYPELIGNATTNSPADFLYDGSPTDLADRMVWLASRWNQDFGCDTSALATAMRTKFDWSSRASVMDQQLAGLALQQSSTGDGS